jgi:hypothetical protein
MSQRIFAGPEDSSAITQIPPPSACDDKSEKRLTDTRIAPSVN